MRRTSDTPALELRGIAHNFGIRHVLKGISLSVPRSSSLCLLGPSGCGKTTLLRIVAGLLRPDRGEVLFDGRMMNNVPTHERDVGFVFQTELALFRHLNVWGNIAFPFRHGRKQSPGVSWRAAVNAIIDHTQLASHKYERISNLSGGLRQRVAIARALVYRPSILLLDEPLSSLDNYLKNDLLRLLSTLHGDTGATFVYVTHDDREARSFASHVAVMVDGVIEQFGPTNEVFANPRTETIRALLGQGTPEDKHREVKTSRATRTPGGE